MRVLRGHTYQELHFIVGIGRSGTTILSKLLNNYPDLHCLPEANFFLFFLYKYKDKTHFSKADVDLVFEQIKTYALSHPLIEWEFNEADAKKEVTHFVENNMAVNYGEFCKIIYRHFKVIDADKAQAKILIDKNPSYTLFLKHIARSFPDSKFIIMLRDYRANVLSRKQHTDLKSPNVPFNACRWKIFNMMALGFKKVNPKKTLLIRYEDLVMNNEAELEKISNFLNITHIHDLASKEKKIHAEQFGKFPKDHVRRFKKKYADLNKPLNSGRLNSWQEQLTATEITTCDAICANFAAPFGYKAQNELNRFTKIRILCKNLLPITRAWIDVKKDLLIYYIPVTLKLSRLKKKYRRIGLLDSPAG